MTRGRGLAVVVAAVALLLTALPMLGRRFASDGFSLRNGIDAYPSRIGTYFEVDSRGVAIYRDSGGTPYLQPVNAAQRALGDLAAYRSRTDPAGLAFARNAADALIAAATPLDDRLYFPYRFDVRVGTAQMRAPWYSGMAQGQALSLLVRLSVATGSASYRNAAHSVLLTFDPAVAGPRTAYVDERGYYWIDEYVTNPPDPVLNGFIFSLFGLYDYWDAYHDDLARRLFDAGATTVLHNVYRYRDPGHLSWYDVDHKQRAKPGYHDIHVDQLRLLGAMTGDASFDTWSRLLADDAP